VTRRGWLLFVALCVIWGIPYLLIKVAVREISPASLVFLRTAIGALVLLPLAAARGDLRALLPHWRPIALFTAVEIAMPWLLLADAERRLTSSLAGLLVAAVPLAGVVIARLSGSPEPLGERRMGGLWVGLAGVAVLLGLDVRGGDLGAVGEMVLVVIGYAVGPMVVSRRLTDVPTLDVVAVSLGLGALAYAPVGVAQLPPALPAPEVIGAVVVLGVLCTAVAFVLFFQLIAEVGPVRATVVAYVNPAIAVAAGVALLGEPLTVGTVAGFALILAGSWLATGSRAPAVAGPAQPVASS
jgi:drug/metabolite transporter (DMT)-like permease